MAVTANKITTTLVLKIKTGTMNGSDVLKGISLRKVKSNAADEDVYAVAAGISALLTYPTNGVFKQDSSELLNN